MRFLKLAATIGSACALALLSVSSAASSTSPTQYAMSVMSLNGSMTNPYGITTGPDGNLWFTECTDSQCNGSSIGSLNPTSGVITDHGVAGSVGFGPENITTGPDSALWFTQAGPSGYIGRITTDGQISYPLTGVSYPEDITSGPDGNLWFTTAPPDSTGSIGVLTPSGTLLATYTGQGINIGQPGDRGGAITAGPDGNLWFANTGSNTIGQITPSGTVTIFSDPSISQPEFITTGPDGNLWFTNGGNNSIGQITTAGVVSNFTGPGISQPTDITTGADGNLWFTNWGDDSLGSITTTGTVSWFPEAGISQPGNITTNPNGGLWFASNTGASIEDLTPQAQGANPVTIANPGGQTTYQFAKVNLKLAGTAANGGALSWRGVGVPSVQSVSGTGQFSGQITAAPGTFHTKVGALDTGGSGAVAGFTWNVKADVGSNVTNAASGTCLNNLSFWITPGNPIVNWKCFKSGPNEMFSHPANGELVVLGQCVTDPGTGGKGTAQVIEPCTGASNQTWTHRSNGEYVLKLNGLCMTDPSGSSANGTPIKVYPCKNVKDQHWS